MQQNRDKEEIEKRAIAEVKRILDNPKDKRYIKLLEALQGGELKS